MSSIVLTCSVCKTATTTAVQQLLTRPRCPRCQNVLSSTAPAELTRDSVDGVIKNSPLPVLMVFYSQWNAPSSMAAPVLAEVALRYSGRLLVARLNADMLPDVTKRYGATTLPTLITYRGGNERKRVLGAHSVVEIEQLLSDSGFTR